MPRGTPPNLGEKTIKLTIYLFTDGISKEEGRVLKKHAWNRGTVCLQKNLTHGISGTPGKNFNCFEELPKVIKDVIDEQGIVIH